MRRPMPALSWPANAAPVSPVCGCSSARSVLETKPAPTPTPAQKSQRSPNGRRQASETVSAVNDCSPRRVSPLT
ncbi:MAG TPA: hypothetical protein DFS52_03660, partial [Myxococcales bacterium]|nr:hypothetical protein [Myxococcales bacterium]